MEKQLLKFLSIYPLLSVITACNNGLVENSVISDYSVVSGTFTRQDTTAIAGTGTVRFLSPLDGVTSNKALEIAGDLSNNGSVAAVFNSDDMSLPSSRGVIVKIARDGLLTSVIGQISVNGVTVSIQPTRLTYVLAGSFDLIIQVYNTPTYTRVLLWRKDSVTYSLANVEVDSSILAHLVTTFPSGAGAGYFVGLQLVSATLTTAQLQDPKVSLP